MCGIFGIVAPRVLTRAQEEFLAQSMITGQLRGDDGSGYFTVTGQGVTQHFKRALDGNDFLSSRVGVAATKAVARAQIAVGHNRKTTSGGDADRNCHPFNYDSLVGVHNGGVPWGVLNRLDTTGHSCEVDSAKVFAALHNGENYTDVLSEINEGAYALVWYDKEEEALKIARDNHRPLWMSYGTNGLYFASEPGMLYWLMARNKLDNEASALAQFKPHTLYTIPMNDPTKMTTQSYKVAERATSAGYRGWNRTYDDNRPAVTHGGTRGFPIPVNTAHRQEAKVFENPEDLVKEFPFFATHVGELLEASVEAAGQKPDKTIPLDVVILGMHEDTKTYLKPALYGCVFSEEQPALILPVRIDIMSSKIPEVKKLLEDGLTNDLVPVIKADVKKLHLQPSGDIYITCDITGTYKDDPDGLMLQEEYKDYTEAAWATLTAEFGDWSNVKLANHWEQLKQSSAIKSS